MIHKLIALTAGLALALTFVASAAAAEDTVKPATVVIYRADELPATGRVKLDVHVDTGSLGRLSSEDVIVVEGAPGSYTLGSSIADTQPLILDLKAGQTHYVHTQMKMLGNRVYVQMVEVEEQTAKVQNPSLEDII
jgi:hypothetical protein